MNNNLFYLSLFLLTFAGECGNWTAPLALYLFRNATNDLLMAFLFPGSYAVVLFIDVSIALYRYIVTGEFALRMLFTTYSNIEEKTDKHAELNSELDQLSKLYDVAKKEATMDDVIALERERNETLCKQGREYEPEVRAMEFDTEYEKTLSALQNYNYLDVARTKLTENKSISALIDAKRELYRAIDIAYLESQKTDPVIIENLRECSQYEVEEIISNLLYDDKHEDTNED